MKPLPLLLQTAAAFRSKCCRFLALLLPLLAAACSSDPHIHLTGEVQGLTQTEVLLFGFRPDTALFRAIPQQGGSFQTDFLAHLQYPSTLLLDGQMEIPIFAEPGDKVRIKGSLRQPEKITVEGGSKLNQELNKVRAGQMTAEDFVRKYPDHLASAWLLLNMATHSQELDVLRLERIYKLLTPRIAQLPMLKGVREEFGRHDFFHELDIPQFQRPAHVVIKQDRPGQDLDTTFTNEQLVQQLRKLAN